MEARAGTHRFAHWIERAAGYEALLLSVRRTLHESVAHVLEASAPELASLADRAILQAVAAAPEETPVPDVAAPELAVHWERAARPERAAAYALLAARAALARARSNEAELHAASARRLIPSGRPLAEAAARLARRTALLRLSRFEEALSEAREARAAIGRDDTADAALLSVRSLLAEASALERLSRFDEAETAARAGLDGARKHGSVRDEALALNTLGTILAARGDFASAESRWEEAFRLRIAIGDAPGAALAKANLGTAALVRGDLDRAEALHQESLAFRRGVGNAFEEASSLDRLAIISERRGDVDECEARARRAFELSRSIGYRYGEAGALHTLAQIEHRRGRNREALRLAQECLAIRREIGDLAGQAVSLANIGISFAAEGRCAAAVRRFDLALALARTIRHSSLEGAIRLRRAEARARLGRIEDLLGGESAGDHDAGAYAGEYDQDARRRIVLARIGADETALASIAADPDAGELGALALIHRAALLARRGEDAAANTAFEEAERLASRHAQPRLVRAARRVASWRQRRGV